MGRTKLDNRIRTLIENGVATGHRSMFAVVGNKAKDQVVILHHILSKASVTARPSVLWCYKKDLGFSSNRQKRAREIKAKQAAGNTAIRDDDPFEVFVSSTQIRYCYYSETHKILGNTFGMLVLQDFEALTPNLLARTIETIEGGGLVVLLMQSVNSLRQLFTLTMDVHNRYRTEAHTEIVARFNERFILSLASCQSCCVVDDQLNILPISSHINKIEALPPSARKEVTASDEELSQLKESMKDTKPIGDLLVRTRTACQAKCVLRLLDVITEKQLNATCSITAARGRGKSAALGLSLAGAIAFGYTNIFVTSPSPENLKTLFQFVVKGFDAIDYQEHTDYELVQSTNPEFNKALVRINVFREHRQTIQYIHPSDAVKLGQAELVVIDEAAAIPLPLVKDLISGSYLVFLASTVNGYEGTGRSLSLKLLQQLRQQAAGCAKGEKQVTSKGRVLHEMVLEESIRYKPGDKVENWLNRVLCLDAAGAGGRLGCGTPPPRDCQLYYVNRDTLFSFHKASESFLHQLMSIYVSAHYKNTPNDLQMLSDAPAHHLFVLMAPVDEQQSQLPDVLAVVQVCLEGSLSKERVEGSLQQGKRAAGDLLPWTISQQFMDSEFPTLCGARIVRLAVHPDYQSMGYGGRAMELLQEYYMGRVPCLDEKKAKSKDAAKTVKDAHTLVLLEEQVAPRVDLPPLLRRLDERKAERLDYIGVSYGLTLGLLKFWKKAGFVPVYVRQNANDLTGEYTCIMLRKFEEEEDDDASAPPSWLSVYWGEFRRRIVALLGFEFRKFPAQLALSILQLRNKDVEKASSNKVLSRSELGLMLSNTDLRRLSQFAKNMADHTLVTDMLPTLGRLYFNQHLGEGVKLSAVQAAILLAIGLQHKSVDDLVAELDMPANQILALYVKTMRRLSEHLDGVCADAVRAEMEKPKEGMEGAADATKHMNPLAQSLEDEMNEAEAEIKARQARDKKNMLNELSTELQQYAIKADDEAWKAALQGDNAAVKKLTGLISVKSKRKLKEMAVPEEKDKHAGKKKKRTTHMDKGIQK